MVTKLDPMQVGNSNKLNYLINFNLLLFIIYYQINIDI